MISAGRNIESSSDMLNRIKVEHLYHSLQNPKQEIETAIRQLRIVRNIDLKQYSILKRKLPYIVCAMFNPSFRKKDNFAYTEYFIIDIDSIAEKDLQLPSIRKNIEMDERVLMSFISPSEDGLKVMFRLKERCYDAGMYSLFYKSFVKEFSVQHDLHQVIDGKTCDVSRACFISIDSEAYYNPLATPIDINNYLSHDPSVLNELKFTLEKEALQNDKIELQENMESHSKDPDQEVMDRIRQQLNPRLNNKASKPEPYVPEELNLLMDNLISFVNLTGVETTEVINIQYGKKLRFLLGLKEAEINLFYGKRGFTIVKSPRCGTTAELNDLMADVLNNFLMTYQK